MHSELSYGLSFAPKLQRVASMSLSGSHQPTPDLSFSLLRSKLIYINILLFLSCVCSSCALSSIAIVLSPAVAHLVVVTKSIFCIHYIKHLLVERMIGCVVLHELLELIGVLVLDGEFVRCKIRCKLFLLGICRLEGVMAVSYTHLRAHETG